MILRISLDIDMELPEGTTDQFAGQVVDTTRERVVSALDAIDVSVADWWFEK
jgi:hypothetical protein